MPFLESFWFGSGDGLAHRTGASSADGATGGNGHGNGRGPGGGDGHGSGPDDGGTTGLTALIELAMANADPAVVNAIPLGKDTDGTEIFVRNGRYGPYLKTARTRRRRCPRAWPPTS